MLVKNIKSNYRLLLASLLLTALLAGCGAQESGKAGSGSGPTGSEPSPTSGVIESELSAASSAPTDEAETSTEAVIFFPDSELQNVIERKVTLTHKDDTELVKAAIMELQKEGEDGGVAVWKNIHVISASVKDGSVTLDIQIPDEARLGAPGELQLIETLKSTLFQFENVKTIELLVQGEAVESLMGHVELDHPIRK